MKKLKFGPLPERTTGRWSGRWEDIREQLHARPGEWALIETRVPKARRMTARKALPSRDGYEVETFHVEPDDDYTIGVTIDIYARFVGKKGGRS